MRKSLPLVAALAMASALAGAPPGLADDTTATPVDAPPDYTLKKWMRDNMNGPIETKNFAALATALTKTAALAPPGPNYPKWVGISQDGAKAASNAALNDDDRMKAIKAVCRTCHELYKDKYKAEFPNRAVPKN